MKYTQLMLLIILNWLNGAKLDVVQKGAEIHCDPDIPSRIPPIPQPGGSHDPNSGSRNCPQGEYLEWYWCSPCPDGTFRTRQMTLEDKYSRCQKCQTPDMYEIVTESCTRSRDTKIMCEDGFFRYKVPGNPCQSHCNLCDICGVGRNMFKTFVGRECSEYNNTVCCESEDMVVVDGTCVRVTKTTATTTTQTPLISPKYISVFLHASQLGYEDIDMRNTVSLATSNQYLRMFLVLKTVHLTSFAVYKLLRDLIRCLLMCLLKPFEKTFHLTLEILATSKNKNMLNDYGVLKSLRCIS